MVKRVSYRKCGQVQTTRSAVLWGLQHILSGQSSCGPVTQGKGILQEFQGLGFSLQIRGAVPPYEVLREFFGSQFVQFGRRSGLIRFELQAGQQRQQILVRRLPVE